MRLKENNKFHDFNYINKKIASLKNIYIEIFNVVIQILK